MFSFSDLLTVPPSIYFTNPLLYSPHYVKNHSHHHILQILPRLTQGRCRTQGLTHPLLAITCQCVKECSNCYGIVITLSSDCDDISTARFPSRSHSTLWWRVNLETVFRDRWLCLCELKGKTTDVDCGSVKRINWCRYLVRVLLV